jgi:hypothetical protein
LRVRIRAEPGSTAASLTYGSLRAPSALALTQLAILAQARVAEGFGGFCAPRGVHFRRQIRPGAEDLLGVTIFVAGDFF